MQGLFDDLRYARRSLLSQRGFLAAAIVAIAAGVGANATVFSAIQAILLRPLPFPEAHNLMAAWQQRPGGERNYVSARTFVTWKQRARTLAPLAAIAAQFYNATGDGPAEQLIAGRISPELFDLLRVRPALGRNFHADEAKPGAPGAVILSHGVWMRRYGGRRDAIGSVMTLDGAPYAIAGVMPADFYFLSKDYDIFVPLRINEANPADSHTLQVVGRLAPGADLHQARSEFAAISQALEIERPERNKGWKSSVVPLQEDLTGKLKPSLLALLGAAGVLLLIAVSNVSNLLLARGSARQPEIAVRCALGASPSRVARQLLTESVVLGTIGGVLGLALAAAAVRLIAAAGPASIPRLDEVRIDGWVVLFTAAVTLAAAVIFGVLPALTSASPDLLYLLKEEGRSSSRGRSARRWQSFLVSWQIGLAVVLLSGAALLLTSVQRLQSVDRGFRPERLLSLRLSLPARYRTPEQRRERIHEIVEKLSALPGVFSTAASTGMPLDGRQTLGMQFRAEGMPAIADADRPHAITHLVTPGLLQTLGLRLRAGRWITGQDRGGGAPVVVISRALAERYWPGQSAVGRRLIIGAPGTGARGEVPREIAGVVDDIIYPTGPADAGIEVYFPLAQSGWMNFYVYLRARGDAAALANGARAAVAALDPDVPVSGVRTVEEELWDINGRRRFDSLLAALLAALALLLTVIGVYGVISCSAARQTRDIALRVAFGAAPSDILLHVMRETLRLCAAGIALGLAAYFPVLRLLGDMLYQVEAAQYWAPAAAALLLTALAMIASLAPARRTARFDPAVVLHEPPRW